MKQVECRILHEILGGAWGDFQHVCQRGLSLMQIMNKESQVVQFD